MIFPLFLTLTLFGHVICASLPEDQPEPSQNITAEVDALYTEDASMRYVSTPGIGKHKLHKAQKKNWNDARNTCLNEGGHLVVVNSENERQVINRILAANKITDEVWIGLHELFKKDEWVSIKDERIDAIGYIYWREREPNNYQNSGEHCVVMNQVGMNDQHCDKLFYFVCEQHDYSFN